MESYYPDIVIDHSWQGNGTFNVRANNLGLNSHGATGLTKEQLLEWISKELDRKIQVVEYDPSTTSSNDAFTSAKDNQVREICRSIMEDSTYSKLLPRCKT